MYTSCVYIRWVSVVVVLTTRTHLGQSKQNWCKVEGTNECNF